MNVSDTNNFSPALFSRFFYPPSLSLTLLLCLVPFPFLARFSAFSRSEIVHASPREPRNECVFKNTLHAIACGPFYLSDSVVNGGEETSLRKMSASKSEPRFIEIIVFVSSRIQDHVIKTVLLTPKRAAVFSVNVDEQHAAHVSR